MELWKTCKAIISEFIKFELKKKISKNWKNKRKNYRNRKFMKSKILGKLEISLLNFNQEQVERSKQRENRNIATIT